MNRERLPVPPVPARRRLSIRRRLAFVALSLTLGAGLSLVAGELFMRAIEPHSDPIDWGLPLPGSARIKGIKPGLSMIHKGVRVETNSFGFREREFTPAVAPDVFRIAVLGDSYTYGVGVEFEDTFCKRLERLLNEQPDGTRYEVINFAVSGYNTLQELATWREVAREFNPDLVLLAYVLNDAEPTPGAPAPAGATAAPSSRVQRSLFGLLHRRLKEYSVLYCFAAPRIGTLVNMLLPGRALGNTAEILETFKEDAGGWIDSRRALGELAQEVRQAGAAFAVAVFPLMLDYEDYPLREAHSRVMDLCRERECPATDLLDCLKGHDVNGFKVFLDGHPNAEAHRLFAEHLYHFLIDAGLAESSASPADPAQR